MSFIYKTKKTFAATTAALLTVAATSSASFAGEDGSPFEGFYLGVRATTAVTKADAAHVLLSGRKADYTSAFNAILDQKSPRGYAGGINAGLGMSWGSLYTSVEASFDLSRGRFEILDDKKRLYGVNPRSTFALTARLGLLMSDDILIYGVVGYESQSMKIAGFSDSSSKDKPLTQGFGGLRFGGGFEYMFAENMAFRIEYTQSRYNEKSFTANFDKFTYKPRNATISVGIVLHMN